LRKKEPWLTERILSQTNEVPRALKNVVRGSKTGDLEGGKRKNLTNMGEKREALGHLRHEKKGS